MKTINEQMNGVTRALMLMGEVKVVANRNDLMTALNDTVSTLNQHEELQERIQQLEENLRLSNSVLINYRSHFDGLRFGNDHLENAYHICLIQIASNEELLNNK